MSLKRILCQFHREETPSCILYPDGYYKCFSCGAYGRIKDLRDVDYEEIESKPRYVEDVQASIARIKALPKRWIRGLDLHADSDSFYCLWPDESYYKRRLLGSTSHGDKYRCPTGVPKPLFVLRPERPSSVGIVVEGELNALSIWEARKDLLVVCPGGAGDFYSSNAIKHLHNALKCTILLVYCDRDKAGALAAIKFKALMQRHVQDVRVHLVEKDFNDVLQEQGPEAIRERIDLDLLGGVRPEPEGL
jgi:hypothetical protein